jgi:hypothetical protein
MEIVFKKREGKIISICILNNGIEPFYPKERKCFEMVLKSCLENSLVVIALRGNQIKEDKLFCKRKTTF